VTYDQRAQDSDSRLPMLFQPDELASDEYQKTFKRTIPFEPEKRLLLAVLEDAIICFQKYFHAQDAKQRRLYEEAVSWILARGDDRAFSFENICETSGLDADYLRMGLLNWRDQWCLVRSSNKSGSHSDRIANRHWSMRGRKR